MTKDQLLQYFKNQIEKIESEGFDLKIWQDSTCGFLDAHLGAGNSFSVQLRSLDYSQKMSYEELYPKKIIDKESSKRKFKGAIQEIIEKIKLEDEGAFQESEKGGKDVGAATLDIVVNSLKVSFTGKQIAEIKALATKAKSANQQQQLLELIKTFDVEVVQQVLVDVVSSKDIWKKM